MKPPAIVAVCLLVLATGCGTLPGVSPPPLVAVQSRTVGRQWPTADPRDAAPAADPDAADATGAPRGSWLSRSEWWARTKRQFERMNSEIRADLDFHETEGLESFGPDAVGQVKLMRSEMGGSGLIGP
jgi:hypothetical protein